MKALSLWQPWASLMAVGAKQIETRSWSTPYTGPILICATASFPREGKDALAELPFQAHLRPVYCGDGEVKPADLPTGEAVAIGRLARCTAITDAAAAQLERTRPDEHAFGYYAEGRFAWVFEDVERFPPFHVKGAQQLWTPDDDAMERLGWAIGSRHPLLAQPAAQGALL